MGVASDTFQVLVNNVAPTVGLTGSSLNLRTDGQPISFSGVRGQTVFFNGSFSDPGFDNPLNTDPATGGETEETFSYSIEWGDGTTDATGAPVIDTHGEPSIMTAGSFEAAHVYTAEGVYEVRVTVSDDDSGESTVVEMVTIEIVSPQVGGDLAVGGTLTDDKIRFVSGSSPEEIKILLDGRELYTGQPTGRLLAFGQAGDDDIQVAGSISLSAWFYGDGGNDRLKGGNGNDALFGGIGDDLILGQSGLDILVGGPGADRIIGNADDDILIAGYTVFDYRDDGVLQRNHDEAFSQIMQRWTSGGGYLDRIRALIAEDFAYHLRSGDTVLEDADADVLTGSAGDDWFFLDDDLDRATDLVDEVLGDDLDWVTAGSMSKTRCSEGLRLQASPRSNLRA